jgi:hypothetical protein
VRTNASVTEPGTLTLDIVFVKNLVNNGIIKLSCQPTDSNIADLMTRPLGGNKIEHLRRFAGLEEDIADSNIHNIEEEC